MDKNTPGPKAVTWLMGGWGAKTNMGIRKESFRERRKIGLNQSLIQCYLG